MTHILPPNIPSGHIHREIMTQTTLFPIGVNLLRRKYNYYNHFYYTVKNGVYSIHSWVYQGVYVPSRV